MGIIRRLIIAITAIFSFGLANGQTLGIIASQGSLHLRPEEYYINDSANFNLTPYAIGMANWTDVIGSPDTGSVSASAPNGWGVRTMGKWRVYPDSSKSGLIIGEDNPLINDFGGFYEGDSAIVTSGFATDSSQFDPENPSYNMELYGLDNTQFYIVRLIGSKNGDEHGAYRQRYYIQSNHNSTFDILSELNAFYNTSWYSQIDTVQPASDGTIKMFIGSRDSTNDDIGSRLGVLSAIQVWQVSKTDTTGHKIALRFFRDSARITLNDGSIERNALVYYPQHQYDSTQNYPIIFYINGGESSGDNVNVVRQFGIPRLEELGHDLYGIKANGDTVRFVVVSPQFQFGESGFSNEGVHNMLADFKTTYANTFPIDTSLCYVVGFSFGGGNVLRATYLYPKDFKAAVALSPVASNLTSGQIGSLADGFKDNGSYILLLPHSDQSLSLATEVWDSLLLHSPQNAAIDQWYGRGHDGFNLQMDTSYIVPTLGQTIYDFLVNPTLNINGGAKFSFTGGIAGGAWEDGFTTQVYGNPSDSVVSGTDTLSGITVSTIDNGTWGGTNTNTVSTDWQGSIFGFYTIQSAAFTSSGSYSTDGANINISGLAPNTDYVLGALVIREGTPETVTKFGTDDENWVNISGEGGIRNVKYINATSDGSGEINCYIYNAPEVSGSSIYGTINGLLVRKKTNSDTPLPPIVNAGADKSITLPVDSVEISATATSPNGSGTIASTTWTIITSPGGSPALRDASQLTTVLYNITVSGDYFLKITAVDDGGRSSSDTMKVTVNPEDSSPESIAKFKFGPSSSPASTGYASVLGDPYTSQRSATQNGVTVTTKFNGDASTPWGNGLSITSYDGGKTTGDNSGIRPDNVLVGFIFSYENGQTITDDNITISGLDPNTDYTLKVGASRDQTKSADGPQLGVMAYTYGGTEHTLDVTDNTANEVSIDVTSNSSGVVTFGVHKMSSPTDTQRTGYIGWLEIFTR